MAANAARASSRRRSRGPTPSSGASVVRETPAWYLADVVVELVARKDLARPIRLAAGAIADDRHLQLTGPGQVGLRQEEVVIGEGALDGELQLWRLVRPVDDGHADARAQPGGLDHQAWVR